MQYNNSFYGWVKAASHDPIFGANYYPNSKKLVMRVNISMNWNNAVIIVGSKKWIVWSDLNNNILKAKVKTLIVVVSNLYLSVIHYPKDAQKCEVLLLISPGAKYFFRRSFAPPCEKVNFTFERSYIASAMRRSMLDVPAPGIFWNIGH